MVTHARVFSLSSRYDLFDEKSGLFIAAILQHTLLNSLNYSNMCSWAKIKDLSIKLPVTETEEIDWEFMEDYIKSLHHKPLTTRNEADNVMPLNVTGWKYFYLKNILNIV